MKTTGSTATETATMATMAVMNSSKPSMSDLLLEAILISCPTG